MKDVNPEHILTYVRTLKLLGCHTVIIMARSDRCAQKLPRGN